VNKIFGFGILLIAGGFYWRFCQDAFSYFTPYMVAGDQFLSLMKLCWYAMPWITMGIGVLLLLKSGRGTMQGGPNG
jgi:hypothetical protein